MNLLIFLILSFCFVNLTHALDGGRNGGIYQLPVWQSRSVVDEILSSPCAFQAELIPFVSPLSASSDFCVSDYWQVVQNPAIKPQDLKTCLLCFKNMADASIFFVKVEDLSSCPIVLSNLYEFQGARFNNSNEYGKHLGTVESITMQSLQWN